MSWFGRQLNSLGGNGLDVGYAYDQSGTRISKTVNGVKYEYQYDGSKLFYEKRDNAEFYYQYDGSGNLSTIIHYDGNGNRAQYYVLCNSRGDVVDIYDQNGQFKAHYIYDSWGNTISIKDHLIGGREMTDPTNIGILNQIRYRGYYLDTETGYYYLMSRYYNPEIGRFLNADSTITTIGLLGTNKYVYCYNNPVIFIDLTGYSPESNNASMTIVQCIAGAICLDVLNTAFGFFNIDLTQLMDESISKGCFGVFKEFCYSLIALFSVAYTNISGYFKLDIYSSMTLSALEKCYESNEKAYGIPVDYGVLNAFGLFFSLMNLGIDIDNAGKGVFTRTEDIVFSIVSFAVDVFLIFADFSFGINFIVTSILDYIIPTVALRLKGYVVI